MAELNNIHKAYDRLHLTHKDREAALSQNLDKLIELSRKVESPLYRKMKPYIAVTLKWKFDYLCKTLESPFELEDDVNCWIRQTEILTRLGEQGWFDVDNEAFKAKDPWERTAEGFDFGWTTTTAGDEFERSKKIAKERLDQIVDMIEGHQKSFEGKEILDSGCGPGRYIDLMRDFNPKKITGMDQGERLIKVLKERFKDDKRVEITKGTCEKLEFKDDSFDIVFSNGVIHHTSADLLTMLKDHARVLRKGGVMFIMLIGKGGLELKMWEFLRNFLYDVPIQEMVETLRGLMSPLRLQGVVDHMYGEYQETDRETFEKWCEPIFTRIQRVPGIAGLDVTPELYTDDPYYQARFGCGQLRYLCYK